MTRPLSAVRFQQASVYVVQSQLASQLRVFLEGLSRVPQRRREIVNLLTSFLAQLGQAGPYGAEFFGLYMSLARKEHWRDYLVIIVIVIIGSRGKSTA